MVNENIEALFFCENNELTKITMCLIIIVGGSACLTLLFVDRRKKDGEKELFVCSIDFDDRCDFY